MPLISVIVPVYNVEAYLPRCIDSVLNQTYGNLEILLVNDGSRDNSGSICDEYARKDSRIRVFHKENGGQSTARNLALDAMTGEFVTFVDSDDWLETDAYESMLALAQREQVKLVSAGRWDVSAETGEKEKGLCPQKTEVLSAEEMLGRLFIWDGCDSSPCDKLFHRSLFDEIRFPSKSNCEDVAIVYKLVEAADFVAMLDKPIYNYYHRQGSTSNSALSERTFYFEDYTETILPYIQQKFPSIFVQARYFRVRSLIYSVLSVDLAEPKVRKVFLNRGRKSRRALRKQLWFVLRYPGFSIKEKLINVLLAFDGYRLARKLLKG
jgi:glycosyltransferase involved in cell wall biosynthesis